MVFPAPLGNEEHGTVLGLQIEDNYRQQENSQGHVRINRVRLQILQILGAASVIKENEEPGHDEVNDEVGVQTVHLLFEVEDDLWEKHGPHPQNQDEVVLEVNVVQDEVEQSQNVKAHLEEVKFPSVLGIADIDILEPILDFPNKKQYPNRQNNRQKREPEKKEQIIIQQANVFDG